MAGEASFDNQAPLQDSCHKYVSRTIIICIVSWPIIAPTVANMRVHCCPLHCPLTIYNQIYQSDQCEITHALIARLQLFEILSRTHIEEVRRWGLWWDLRDPNSYTNSWLHIRKVGPLYSITQNFAWQLSAFKMLNPKVSNYEPKKLKIATILDGSKVQYTCRLPDHRVWAPIMKDKL